MVGVAGIAMVGVEWHGVRLAGGRRMRRHMPRGARSANWLMAVRPTDYQQLNMRGTSIERWMSMVAQLANRVHLPDSLTYRTGRGSRRT